MQHHQQQLKSANLTGNLIVLNSSVAYFGFLSGKCDSNNDNEDDDDEAHKTWLNEKLNCVSFTGQVLHLGHVLRLQQGKLESRPKKEKKTKLSSQFPKAYTVPRVL